MTIRDVMTSYVKVCSIDASADDAANLMWKEDCGIIPLVDEVGRLAGLVTDRDLCMAAHFSGLPLGQIRLAAVGKREPIALQEYEGVDVAEELMARHRIRRLPVVDPDNRVIGIVSMCDLVRLAGHTDDRIGTGVMRTLGAISEDRGAEVAIP